MSKENLDPQFVPALEKDYIRVIKSETGLSPADLLAMDFESRRAELEKVGVRLQDPKSAQTYGPTKMYYKD